MKALLVFSLFFSNLLFAQNKGDAPNKFLIAELLKGTELKVAGDGFVTQTSYSLTVNDKKIDCHITSSMSFGDESKSKIIRPGVEMTSSNDPYIRVADLTPIKNCKPSDPKEFWACYKDTREVVSIFFYTKGGQPLQLGCSSTKKSSNEADLKNILTIGILKEILGTSFSVKLKKIQDVSVESEEENINKNKNSAKK